MTKSKQKIHAVAVYPGSFDPITNGHVDLINRLSRHFPSLVVLISQAKNKKCFFTLKERAGLAGKCLKGLSNVSINVCKGLVVEYMRENNIKIMVRGIRVISDFEYEMALAEANKKLYKDCETFIAFTHPKFTHLSSGMVKNIAFFGASIKDWVPEPVERALRKKISG